MCVYRYIDWSKKITSFYKSAIVSKIGSNKCSKRSFCMLFHDYNDLNNTSAIEVISRSTTVNKTAGLVRDTSLRTVGSLQLCCTVVDISLPTGDANPGNVVAMLKLMRKQQNPFHYEAIMTSSKALVEELSNQESLRTTESQWGQILRNHDRTM